MKKTKTTKEKNKNLRNLNRQIDSVIRFGHCSYSTASNYFYCLRDFESESRFLLRHTKVLHEGRCHGSIDLEEEERRIFPILMGGEESRSIPICLDEEEESV